MDKIATENLFLLEFLVDNIQLDPACDCDDDDEGEKCVSFQFLDNAPLDVCEADFNPQRNYESKCPKDTNVKSGKSCLFSLSPEQAEEAVNSLDIFLSIFMKMPSGWSPAIRQIGTAVVPISRLFEELIDSITTSNGQQGTNPMAKTLKDVFDILSPSGESCGKIGVYIRMSCFGKLIVTQFQMNLQDKSVLFKDKEGRSLYRYKKAGKGSKNKNGNKGCTPKALMPNSYNRYNSNCPISPCDNNRNSNNRNGNGRRTSVSGNDRSGGDCKCSSANDESFFPEVTTTCVESCPYSPCLPDQGRGADSPIAGFNGKGFAQMALNVTGGPGMTFSNAITPGMNFNGIPAPGMGNNIGAAPGVSFYGGGIPGGMPVVTPNMNGTPPGMPRYPPAMSLMAPGMNGLCFNNPGAPGSGNVPCLECATQPVPPCAPPAGPGGSFGVGYPVDPNMRRLYNGNGYGGGMVPSSVQGSSRQNTPCSECSPCPYTEEEDSCICGKTEGGPDGNYQEIGASMGGNTLTIRVHKDKGKVEAVEDSTTESCVCGNKGNNMSVNMSPGIKEGGNNHPFAFKMGHKGQPGGNNVVVTPPTAYDENGAKVTEFSDPNKELFVLRIGKKSEGVDKKQNLELELCTPKGPEKKPKPKQTTADTQYDPKDVGPENGKKDKGKGKKGGKKKK